MGPVSVEAPSLVNLSAEMYMIATTSHRYPPNMHLLSFSVLFSCFFILFLSFVTHWLSLALSRKRLLEPQVLRGMIDVFVAEGSHEKVGVIVALGKISQLARPSAADPSSVLLSPGLINTPEFGSTLTS